jgi:hypothetical protein
VLGWQMSLVAASLLFVLGLGGFWLNSRRKSSPPQGPIAQQTPDLTQPQERLGAGNPGVLWPDREPAAQQIRRRTPTDGGTGELSPAPEPEPKGVLGSGTPLPRDLLGEGQSGPLSALINLGVLGRKAGEAAPSEAESLTLRGLDQIGQRKFDEAEPLLRRALTLRGTVGADVGGRSFAELLLGFCLLGQQKDAEAEPLLLSGFTGLIDHPPGGRSAEAEPLLIEVAEGLNQFYGDRLKVEQADQWRQRLEALKTKPRARP